MRLSKRIYLFVLCKQDKQKITPLKSVYEELVMYSPTVYSEVFEFRPQEKTAKMCGCHYLANLYSNPSLIV